MQWAVTGLWIVKLWKISMSFSAYVYLKVKFDFLFLYTTVGQAVVLIGLHIEYIDVSYGQTVLKNKPTANFW